MASWTVETFVRFCRHRPLRRRQSVQVVVRETDATGVSPWLLQLDALLSAPSTEVPLLTHLEFDHTATRHQGSLPAFANRLLRSAFARSLSSFTLRVAAGSIRYTAIEGGWAAEVDVEREPPDMLIAPFGPTTRYVRSITVRSAVALKKALMDSLRAWQSAVDGILMIETPKKAKAATPTQLAKRPRRRPRAR